MDTCRTEFPHLGGTVNHLGHNMSNSQGWISLHRKLLENPLFKDPQALTLWVYLLLRANHSNTKALIGNNTVPIKRGQFLTGRKSLAASTGINESKIERLLKLFKSDQQIEQQTFTKYRLISIVNYESYQNTEQQTNNKRTTNEQQLNTDNNVNNGNNDNKELSVTDVWLGYFNSTTGRQFKNSQGLTARLNEYSEEDIKLVIDYKNKQWKGTSQEKYLRPETIFKPSKFESYLNDAKTGVPTHEENTRYTDNSAAGQVRAAAKRELAKLEQQESNNTSVVIDGKFVRS